MTELITLLGLIPDTYTNFMKGNETMKRVPDWDEYFIKMAQLVSTKSKDRSTKVGAVIVQARSPISTGFNGFPRGVVDFKEERHERPLKYLITEHAERNAIFNAAREGIRTLGSTLYMYGGGYPCADCARAIVQSGIKEFVTMGHTFTGKGDQWKESCLWGLKMLEEGGVAVVTLDKKYRRMAP